MAEVKNDDRKGEDKRMEEKTGWKKILLTVLPAALTAAGGFYVGKSAEAEKYQAEKEREILINRSDLDGLGEIEGTIYVTGHKSPDSDTVGSSIGYAALLQKLGYDAVPVVLGNINRESQFILESAGVEVPELLEDASGKNMILVDHSEYTQSAEGLRDAHIVSIIDHHGDGAVTTGNQLIYDSRPLGATATIIWIRYRHYGIEIDPKTAAVMAGSILSDTQNLRLPSTTYADREALKDLCGIGGITDVDAFYQEMFKASISYEGMSDEEIFFSDYKEYEASNTSYSIPCINAYDEETAKDLAARMKKVFPEALKSKGMDMGFALISIFHDDISISYVVPSDEAAKEVLDTAYGDVGVYDGVSYRIEPGFSRKGGLVPAVTDILQAYPQE